MSRILAFLLTAAAVASCGDARTLKNARYRYKMKAYPEALKSFDRLSAKAAKITDKQIGMLGAAAACRALGLHDAADARLLRAARLEPFNGPASAARAALVTGRDFLPLSVGQQWVEVDSASHGKNLYNINTVSKQGKTFILKREFYAGKPTAPGARAAQVTHLFIDKADSLINERLGHPDTKESTLLLRFPYREGSSWLTKRSGYVIRRSITKVAYSAKIAAAHFTGCIEIEEARADAPDAAKIYETFCPETGRIQTMTGTRTQRYPATELLPAPQTKVPG